MGALALLACSPAADDDGDGSGLPSGSGAAAPGSGSSNGVGGAPSGGATATGGSEPGGGSGGSGGADAGTGGLGTGGVPAEPVDCSGITTAGFELCESGGDFCGAVFQNGAGCTEVCAAAGLACETARENVDGACAADEALPALPCDSGHQSDYCVCRGVVSGTGGSGSGGAGSGGTAGSSTGGSGGSSSGGSGGTPGNVDCNDITSQPILHVDKSGSGNFTTVQAAVDSLPKSNTTPTQIRIAPGTYTEKLRIDRPNITLCGRAGQASSTILTYGDNANTPNGQGGTLGTTGSASTNISANRVSAENITFKNNTPLGGSQAVALLVSSNEVQFRNCRFSSYQDTLYVKGGTQYFKDCYVEGSVDFIFGASTAVFDECTIHNAAGGVAITAPSTEETTRFGLVFLGGQVTAAANVSNVALGRNWRPYGAATYIGTTLGGHINKAGWIPMGSNTLDTARFSEYQTTGPGARPNDRTPFSSQLTSAQAADYTLSTIFGSWTPSFSQ